LLATAFLIVNLFTLSGWVMQKRAEFKLYENGFTYKKHICRWDEIESITVRSESRASGTAKIGCKIRKIKDERIVLTEAIQGVESIIKRIDAEIAKRSLS
jgi:hypothetical protein